MKINFGNGAVLQVPVTKKMVDDYKDCQICAQIPNGEGKNCAGCSLDVDILGHGLCELPVLTATLERIERGHDKYIKLETRNGSFLQKKESEILKTKNGNIQFVYRTGGEKV